MSTQNSSVVIKRRPVLFVVDGVVGLKVLDNWIGVPFTKERLIRMNREFTLLATSPTTYCATEDAIVNEPKREDETSFEWIERIMFILSSEFMTRSFSSISFVSSSIIAIH